MLQAGTADGGLPTAWDAGRGRWATAWDAGRGGGAELKQAIRDVEDEPEGPGEEGLRGS